MAVASDDHQVYGPISGSSVSTAVASGVAALVWSYRPSLGPAEFRGTVHGDLTAHTVPDPWVVPQPDIPPCPMCGITGSKGNLERDPEYDGYTLVATQIVLWNDQGDSEVHHYPSPPLEVTSTAHTVVENAEFLEVAGKPTARRPSDIRWSPLTGAW